MFNPGQIIMSLTSMMVTGDGAANVRYNRLKFMYAYTLVIAGSIGLLYLILPDTFIALLGFPAEEPIFAGVAASVYVAFAVLSILGLQSPLKFAPILLLQLAYKIIWFIAVIIPRVIGGNLPSYAVLTCIIFATFVIGDLIAIPFQYLFAK